MWKRRRAADLPVRFRPKRGGTREERMRRIQRLEGMAARVDRGEASAEDILNLLAEEAAPILPAGVDATRPIRLTPRQARRGQSVAGHR